MLTTIYTFPQIIDPDIGSITSISVVKDSVIDALPSFLTKTSTSLTINPTLAT
jgi:hypothetical protein